MVVKRICWCCSIFIDSEITLFQPDSKIPHFDIQTFAWNYSIGNSVIWKLCIEHPKLEHFDLHFLFLWLFYMLRISNERWKLFAHFIVLFIASGVVDRQSLLPGDWTIIALNINFHSKPGWSYVYDLLSW